MAAVLDRIPAGGICYLSIDADGIDPTVMSAVAAPAPGGLLYHQVRELIHGVVKKGRVHGMDIVEITPARDFNEITSIVAGRFIRNLIGATVRANYFG
jgi:agmatinase